MRLSKGGGASAAWCSSRRSAPDMIYLDSAKFAEFMKADNEDNGAALKSLGLAK